MLGPGMLRRSRRSPGDGSRVRQDATPSNRSLDCPPKRRFSPSLFLIFTSNFRDERRGTQTLKPVGAAAALRAHGQGGYLVSASKVSAPPYGKPRIRTGHG